MKTVSGKKLILQRLNIHFFVIAITIAIGVFVATMGNSKYVVDLDMILLPKNEKTAVQVDQIRGNLVTLFEKNNSFKGVSVKTRNDNTLISIQSKDRAKKDAIKTASEVSRGIVDTASKYYHVKNDLDIRIVRGEAKKDQRNVFIVVLISIVAGGILSFLIQLIIGVGENAIVKFIQKKKKVFSISKNIESVLKKNRSKIQELSYFSKKREPAVELFPEEEAMAEINDLPADVSDEIEAGFKKAASPQNLPMEAFNDLDGSSLGDVQSATVPDNLPFEVADSGEAQSSQAPDASNGEPTDEEYRERLNQLLKGE